MPGGKRVPLGKGQVYFIEVPCGKCAACLAQYQMQWSFRLEQEALYGGHASTLFVTLTYDNDSLPSDLSVHKEEIVKYIHDLRQNITYYYGKDYVCRVKYFFCAEYGSKRGRPHYHALLFFSKCIDWTLIQKSWNKGIVDIRPFSSARAGYVAKYSVKQIGLDYEGREPPFHMQSNGLGKCFLDGKSLETLRYKLYWRNLSGRSVKLPRYYLENLAVTRVRYRFKDDDGNVYTKSFSHPTLGKFISQAISRNEFLKRDSLERAKFGNTYKSYDLWKYENSINLEYTLQSRFNNESQYMKLSRLGL